MHPILCTTFEHSESMQESNNVPIFAILGKHNGCVQGVRYFSCKPKHGIFVRPDRLCPTTVDCSSPLITEAPSSDERQHTKRKSSLRREGKSVVGSGDAKRLGSRKAVNQNQGTKR